MTEGDEYPMKRTVWLGPQQMSDNGLGLRAIVTEDHGGGFWAGTRYGPRAVRILGTRIYS